MKPGSNKEEDPLVASLPFTINGYYFESVLGSGSFSTVFKVLHQSSNIYFAAKAMRSDMQTKMDVIGAEIDSLMHLYHQNIIKIYELFKAENHIFIIIELCNGKTIRQVIEQQGSMPFDQLVSCFRQILSAISYCHKNKIAHRDIKPANIFIESDGRCIIGDFGLSCIEEENSTAFCGSLAYKPPEILLKHAYNPLMADIWSLGVTFYVMAVGRIPWQPSHMMPVERCIISADYYVPPVVNRDISALIKSMIVTDPNRRKSADELLQSPIFDTKNASKLFPLKEANKHKIPLCVRSNSVRCGLIVVPKASTRSSSKTSIIKKKMTVKPNFFKNRCNIPIVEVEKDLL